MQPVSIPVKHNPNQLSFQLPTLLPPSPGAPRFQTRSRNRRRTSMTIKTARHTSPLLQRIREVSAAAQQLGTLKSIDTTSTLLTCANSPPFLVRVVQNLVRKGLASNNGTERDPTASQSSADASGKKPTFNPFLPYEASMYVKHVAPRHVILLNKFNVVEDHVLLVTEEFEEQNSRLNEGDFEALCECLKEVDGLAFYNSGRIAGASQRHKHLQLICGGVGDMDEGMGLAPFDGMMSEVVTEEGKGEEVLEIGSLGFVHGVMKTGVECAKEWMRVYEMLMDYVCKEMGMSKESEFSYNLVATRRWMMVVPRKEECFEGVSVNSLGFAGCLLVKTEEQLNTVKRVGGLCVLKHTAFEKEG